MTSTLESPADRLRSSLLESEALMDGHFLLSSGRHASRYVQCARMLQHPHFAERSCQDLAAMMRAEQGSEQPYDVVVGPAMGAVTLGYELARALKVRGVFAERKAEGGFDLRRGFSIHPGESVLVAEDVVTTGKSVLEVIDMLLQMGAGKVAVGSLVNRSGTENPFGDHAYYRLLDLEVPSWEPEDCELCASSQHGPAVKPGSRPGIS